MFKFIDTLIENHAAKIAGVLAAAFIGLLIFGMGYSKGNVAGIKEGVDSQQQTIKSKDLRITALVNDESERNKLLNAKVSDLEQRSQAEAQTIRDLQQKSETVRTEIVTKYLTANPQSAQQCALSLPAVQAINQILEAQ